MKKPLNHQRNMNIGIVIALAFALIVSAVNPVNGWVAGLITIVIVVLPMAFIKAIISLAQSKRARVPNQVVSALTEFEDAEPVVLETSAVPSSDEAVDEPLGFRDYRTRGWIHVSLGSIILILSILQIQQAQNDPLWTKMFTEPFWWIIAFCSSVSFFLSISNFNKAAARKEESAMQSLQE